jgi:hypothetical protein
VSFFVLAFVVYAPALGAPFFSDDQHYVQANAHIQNWTFENWIAIWSPTSVVVSLVENWAPVHLTLHALAWQAFGPAVWGHHALGVAMHAVAASLLYVFYVQTGLRPLWGVLLAALFLVHPAGVEAVAWISQVKTTSAMVLSLTALLLHPRRPALALLAFALALLAKPAAVVALPVAWVWGLVDRERAAGWGWLVGWGVVLLGFAVAELAAFYDTAGRTASLYDGFGEQVRSHVGITARYAVMFLTGRNVGLFHEPSAAVSLLDPWWLTGALLSLGVVWRAGTALWHRSPEFVYWTWVAAAFAPASGILALPYPMADRYLYFVLPGLLGVGGVIGVEVWSALSGKRWAVRLRGRGVGAALGLVLVAAFALLANRQASLWARPERLLMQVESAYPAGQVARLRSARRAAVAGDATATVAALRPAVARGFDRLDVLVSDPSYRALRGDPAFDEIVDELATRIVDRTAAQESPSQVELRVAAQAQVVLGDFAAAQVNYLQALERPGPHTKSIRNELEAVRLELRLEAIRSER